MNLLHGTPKGIFQVGHFLIGPLGILDAIQPRYMEPIMTAPLWHCSDISCNALHTVHLASGQPALPLAVSQAVTYFRSAEGNAAEWGGYYAAARGRKTSYYDDLNTDTLPWLLANAFADSEITKISHDLLLKHSKDLRERFPTVRKLSTFR